MATLGKLDRQQTLEKLGVKDSCIIGQGLSMGGTRWILFLGKQRKSGELVDGRVVQGLLKSGLIKESQNGEFIKTK